MKATPAHFLVGTAASLLVATASLGLAEVRTFTNTGGKEIQAQVTSVVGENVSMTLSSGKEFTLPIAKFSEADQTYIRDWATKNKNPVPRTALRLEIKKTQSKVRLDKKDGEKNADYKKRRDASDKSQTLYTLNLRNATRQPIGEVEVDYKIFKRVSRRGFDEYDESKMEEKLVRNPVGIVDASALKEIELEPYITEDIYIKGDKNKDIDDKRQRETLLGIVVKVSAGGKELYKQSLPANLMDRITQEFERDQALAAQRAEREARKEAAEAEREARKPER